MTLQRRILRRLPSVAFLVWLTGSLAVAQESPSPVARAPDEASTEVKERPPAPGVKEVKPDTFLLEDEAGNLRQFLDMLYEDFWLAYEILNELPAGTTTLPDDFQEVGNTFVIGIVNPDPVAGDPENARRTHHLAWEASGASQGNPNARGAFLVGEDRDKFVEALLAVLVECFTIARRGGDPIENEGIRRAVEALEAVGWSEKGFVGQMTREDGSPMVTRG